MKEFAFSVAVLLLGTLVAGMVRVWQGPTAADRMLAAQLFGTTGVASILLLAYAWEMPSLTDVALIFALLASVMGVAFVRRYVSAPAAKQEGDL